MVRFIYNMEINIPAWKHGRRIPGRFTCDEGDASPAVQISEVPEEAKSLALVMDDPDAPMGTYTHWLLWNIDPRITLIPEGGVVLGAREGANTSGAVGYMGPCPPPGKPHRYFFKVFALDAALDIPGGSSREAFEAEIQKHKLDGAEYMGVYER